MMEIKVIGSGCEKCDTLYSNTLAALALLGVEAPVEKVEDLGDIVRLRVMSTPALMADGEVLLCGRSAGVDEVAALLRQRQA